MPTLLDDGYDLIEDNVLNFPVFAPHFHRAARGVLRSQLLGFLHVADSFTGVDEAGPSLGFQRLKFPIHLRVDPSGDIEIVPGAPVLTVRLIDGPITCNFWSSPPTDTEEARLIG